ncbi:MAG: ATP-binding protein, partial [Cyanobacteria bacterium P01_F01_bin.42]
GFLVGFSLVLMGRNLFGNLQVSRSLQQTQRIRVPAALLSATAESNLLRMSSHVRGYLATGDSEFQRKYHAARHEFELNIVELQQALQRSNVDEQVFEQMEQMYQEWKLLPDDLFRLRDNYLLNQPALGLLNEKGDPYIAEINRSIDLMIQRQQSKSPSVANLNLLNDLNTYKSSLALLTSSLRGYLVTQNPSFRFEYGKYLIENKKTWSSLQKSAPLLSDSQQKLFSMVAQGHQQFFELPSQMFEIIEGKERRQDLLLFTTQAEPLKDEIFTLLRAIIAQQQEALTQDLNYVQRDVSNVQIQILLAGVVSLLFFVMIAYFLSKKITEPVSRLIQATTQITEGDFATKAHVESGDEIGILAIAFNKMTAYLKESREELESYSKTLENQALQLEEAIDSAESANQAKSTFLANMSHELRTPLNAILGFTQLMHGSSNLNAEQQGHLSIINQSGEHLLNLINEILEVTKLEAGKATVHIEECHLPSLLKAVVGMFELKAQEKSLRLILKISPGLPHSIKVDSGKLRQVVINLMDNAIKFTQRGSVTLSVSCLPSIAFDRYQQGASEQHLYFEICDTGYGIAADEIPTLFDPFVQSESGKISKEGTGLGLKICKDFISLMNGSIEVVSRLSEGTSFQIEIPVIVTQQAEQTPTMSVADRQLPSFQHAPRILVVEDDTESRTVLSQLLKTVGYHIYEASDARKGFDIWKKFQPDLVLTKRRILALNGIDCTRMIRAEQNLPQPIIVALSASALEQDRKDAIASGCDAFISMPYKEAYLLEIIASYLNVSYLSKSVQEPVNHAPGQAILSQAREGPRHELILAWMTPAWLSELNQAAKQLNGSRAKKLLGQMPEEAQNVRTDLLKLVDNFDFDKLVTLSEECLHAVL